MSNYQIRFKYQEKEITIQCQKDELMRDIISRYGSQSKLSVQEFCFFYNDVKINQDLTLAQINDKDKEILIIVSPKENIKNGNKYKKFNYIKCAQSIEPAILEFSNDYMITLLDDKNKTKKIYMEDYNKTQVLDQTKIKCSICSNTIANQEEFYYCFECEKNLCPKCKSLHQEHKNIIDYSQKYFKCPLNQGENFIGYCFSCKKNVCLLCAKDHYGHNARDFMIKNMDQIRQKNEFYKDIEKVKKIVDDIIGSLKKFKENLNIYVQINDQLNENIMNKNVNYAIIMSLENLINMTFMSKDFKQILDAPDINEKFQKIMSIYELMEDRPNKIVTFDYKDFEIIDNKSFGTTNNFENCNEIELKVKIEKTDINKTIYFFDNTNGIYFENEKSKEHKHNNLREVRKNNATMIIDKKNVSFNKFFKPKKSGIFSIKLLFESKFSLLNCSYMFCECSNIISIDLSKFNAKNVNDMKYMFYGCTSLETINLSSFNTINVTDMQRMFGNCSKLKSLNLQFFNTENVRNMESMFYNCNSLIALDLQSFKTNKVTNMNEMFDGCSSLKILNLSSFNTQDVTAMKYMFNGCSSLVRLNLSSFNMKNVTTMRNMFSRCSSLKILDLPSFNKENIKDTQNMFDGCSELKEFNSKSFNQKNEITMIYKINSPLIRVLGNEFVKNNKGKYKLFINKKEHDICELILCKEFNINKNDTLLTVVLTEIKGGKVTSLESLFDSCSSLLVVDFKFFNTENVTNMRNMFKLCSSLKSLNLKSFNTEKVTDMSYMFFRCSQLKALDLKYFNTENVTNMSNMFFNCKSLNSLDLKSFNVQKVTDMKNMFSNCCELLRLNLSSFNTKEVTSMECMFENCGNLTSLNLSSFNTQNVTTMYAMFFRCYSLLTLDLSLFNTQNVTTMEDMFKGCSSLETLDLYSFKTEKVTSMESMFRDCKNLKTLDLRSFNTENVTSMRDMFYCCSSLKLLDLSSFNATKAMVNYMFAFCTKKVICNDPKIKKELKY